MAKKFASWPAARRALMPRRDIKWVKGLCRLWKPNADNGTNTRDGGLCWSPEEAQEFWESAGSPRTFDAVDLLKVANQYSMYDEKEVFLVLDLLFVVCHMLPLGYAGFERGICVWRHTDRPQDLGPDLTRWIWRHVV